LGDLSEPTDMDVVVRQLGRATAKIHCVADDESDQDLVTESAERIISENVGDDTEALVDDLISFGDMYATRTREDHRLFVGAFRGSAFQWITPT
jgi:hypothetical protein